MNLRQWAARLSAACVLACLCNCGSLAHAANTWDGGGANDNWSTVLNWDNDLLPNFTNVVTFGGTTRLTPNNDLTAGMNVGGLSFASGAGAFNLGGNAITLPAPLSNGAGNTIGGGITNNSASAETISLPITLAQGQHVISTANNTGVLNINGAVTRNANSTVLFTKGATSGGNINVAGSGLTSLNNGIIGGWALFGTGATGTSGTDWATVDGSNNVVAYTGYTALTAGSAITTDGTKNYKITTAGGNVTMASGGTTDINTLVSTAAANQTIDPGSGNTLRVGAKGAIMNTNGASNSRVLIIGAAAGTGFLTAGGADNTAGELTLIDLGLTATNNSVQINSVISNNGSGVVSVNAVGYVNLATANTFTGGTFINQGRVQAGSTGAFGTDGAGSGGNVTVVPGGQAFLNASGTWTNFFTISGVGSTESGGLGAIRLGSGRTLTGPTSGPNAGVAIFLAGNAAIGVSTSSTVSGKITGPGGITFGSGTTNNGNGTFIIGGALANDYLGDTQIGSSNSAAASNVLQMAASRNNIMPHGATGGMGGAATGNLILNAQSATVQATFDLNGTSQTVNGLSSTSTSAANNFVQNSLASSASTLTLGDNNATATFGGIIRDNGGTGGTLGLTKIGTGTQTLSGANSFTGSTTISSGTLLVGSTGSLGNTSVAIGSTGRLTVNGTVAGSVGISSGGVLSGSGNLSGAAQVNSGGAITAGGGATTSSLTFNNSLTFGAGSSDTAALNLTVNSASPTTGAIIANGAVTLNGSAGSVPINIVGPTAIGTYTLVDYNGALGGTGFSAFTLGSTPRLVASLVDNQANTSVDLNVTGVDFPLWSGALSSEWSTSTLAAPKNWVLNSNNATTTDYADGDTVVFSDFGLGRPSVVINSTVTPGSVAVNNNSGTYTFSGSAGIAGNGLLTKNNAGTLVVATNNTFSGGTVINGGTVQVGSGGTSGNLGTGAVTNSGLLVFNRSDALTVNNVIGGSGNITIQSGIVTLGGANTYSGATTLNVGATVIANNSGSFGAAPGGIVTIPSGASLQITNATANALNFGQKEFDVAGTGVDGNGVIVNSGTTAQQNAFQRIKLTGNATFGGATRFDIRAAQSGGVNTASLDLQGNTLTKNGAGQFIVVATDVSDGNLVVNQGLLSIESSSNVLDFGSGKTITYNSGTTAQFFANTGGTVSRPMIVNGAVTMGNNSNTAATIASNITLNGDLTVTALNTNGTGTLTLNGNIGDGNGPHSVTKTNNGTGVSTLVLGGNNNFSGGLNLNGGNVQFATSLSNLGTGPLNFNGGTLQYGPGLTVDASTRTMNFLAGGGTIDTNGNAVTFNNAVGNGGVGGLTKAGTGTLTLAVVGNYSGPTGVAGGTLNLATANNLLPAGNTLAFPGGSGTLEIGSTTQTVSALTVADATAINSFISGAGGTLLVNGVSDLELGPKAPAATGTEITLSMASLSNFVYNSPTKTFRVGLKNGGDAPTGITAENANVTLAANNTITAALLGVGDNGGARNPGAYVLHLGQANTLNVTDINVGYSGRSGATLDLAGTSNATVHIRGLDGTSATNSFNIGRLANNNNTAWTDSVDFSSGTIDALVNSMILGNADATTQTGRQGSVTASFSMGAGTLSVGSITLGRIANTGGNGTTTGTVGGAYSAASTFTMNNAAGTLNATTIALADNTITDTSANSKTVSGTFVLNDGTVKATSIQRGATTGTATATVAFNWAGGTIQNTDAANLSITGVPISLSGPGTFNITGTNTATVNSASPITGGGSLTKTGPGTLTLSANNSYNGTTTVSGGTLLVNGTHNGGGNYTVGASATLGGTGTVGSNISVAAGGVLAPGASIGTLHSTSMIDLNGTLKTELSGNLSDVLDSTGTLNLNSGAIANFSLLSNLTTTHYVFANYAGALGGVGTFSSITFSPGPNIPTPTGATLDYSGGHIALNVSPQSLRGNFNLDGTVDSSDINAMLAALTDLNAYKANHPGIADTDLLSLGDFDNSGTLTNGDIQGMLNYIAGLGAGSGGIASVPEPGTFGLAALAIVGGIAMRRRKKLANA